MPNLRYRHDEFSKIALAEAIEASKEGNIGVGGTVLYKGKPLFSDHNRQFIPYFRSDIHAEMVLVNHIEDQLQDEKSPYMGNYQLISSQEPCPMCMLRLITSGIGEILYVYRDESSPDQGDVTSLERLPLVWGELARRQHIGEADCSPELKEMARQAFLLSASAAAEKILRRR
ncbi:MAG: nucleoside deaminase [Planctomycetes bacterium]|nr:nucleoside deaminase [Planctomycetota bacterium]